MANRSYEQADKDKVVSRCAEVGIDTAIKEIGYPSRDTAIKWCREQGVVPPRSGVHAMMTLQRSVKQINLSVEEILDKIQAEYTEHALEGNHSLIDLKRLGEGIKIHVETLDKVKGKAAGIGEEASSIDEGFMKLVEEMNKKPVIDKPSS